MVPRFVRAGSDLNLSATIIRKSLSDCCLVHFLDEQMYTNFNRMQNLIYLTLFKQHSILFLLHGGLYFWMIFFSFKEKENLLAPPWKCVKHLVQKVLFLHNKSTRTCCFLEQTFSLPVDACSTNTKSTQKRQTSIQKLRLLMWMSVAGMSQLMVFIIYLIFKVWMIYAHTPSSVNVLSVPSWQIQSTPARLHPSELFPNSFTGEIWKLLRRDDTHLSGTAGKR